MASTCVLKKKKEKKNPITKNQMVTSLAQLETIQPKKLNKNNKNIHNDDCILVKKNYFTTKEPKNHVLLEKLKLIFFAITVNWYKYWLTVANC